jgi:hypothetical protein
MANKSPYEGAKTNASVVPTEPKANVQPKGVKVGALGSDYRNRLGELLDLSDEQIRKIKKRLKKEIENWKEDSAELHQRLEEDNDLAEGVVDARETPWDGAADYHTPVTATYMKIFRSVARRSILGADDIWYAESLDPEAQDALAQIEDTLNYNARCEWNIAEALNDVFWTAPRDGLGIIEIVQAEETELASDVLLVTDVNEFMKQFPMPEDAGLSPEAYVALVKQLSTEATMESPVEVPITFNRVKYSGPKAYVIDLVNFVRFPATAVAIEDENCRGYGKRYTIRKGVIKKNGQNGLWYQDVVDRLIRKSRKADVNPFTRAQDRIEGLGRTNNEDDFEFYAVTYRMELDPEEGEKKFCFVYNLDHDELVSAMEFYYLVDNYAIFRIEKRPNRMDGNSIPRQTRDTNYKIDMTSNQRVNSRTVSSVPSFKAKKSLAKDFDPEADENRWRPGVIFWMEEPDSFEQFKVQPTDLGESLQEEANDMKILDLRLGSSAALLSGQVAPGDPTAPGNKQAMMISQANLRMDDPLMELRTGVEKVGDICRSLLYQFGPTLITYQTTGPNGQKTIQTLHKKFLRGDIKMRMAGVTVTHNPDVELQRGFQLYQNLVADPIVAQDDQIRYELLRNALRAGRVSGRDQMLPPLEVVKQRQVEVQKTAMLQMAVEQKQAQDQAAADGDKQRMDASKKELAIKTQGQKVADANVQFKNGTAPK